MAGDSGAGTPHSTGDAPPVRLLDRVRARIRVNHYSVRTEQAYCDWIRRFIIFLGKRHPSALGAADVEAFLTSVAVEGRVSASTQNPAKSALLFLYRDEIARALARLHGVHRLIGALLYGTGLRIMETMRLRVKDAWIGSIRANRATTSGRCRSFSVTRTRAPP